MTNRNSPTQIWETYFSHTEGKYALFNIITPNSVFFVLKIIMGKMHLFPSFQQSCSEPQPDLATSAHLCVLTFLERKNLTSKQLWTLVMKREMKRKIRTFCLLQWGGWRGSSLGQWALRWEASQSVFHGSSHLILSALAIVHNIVKRGKMGSWFIKPICPSREE